MNHSRTSPPQRSIWPWLWFGVIAVLLLSLLWRATAPVSERVALPAPVVQPTSDTPLLLTALAGLPGSAGNPAVLAPWPTETRVPRRDTPTPWPACPAAPGGLCEWPEPTPTHNIAPMPTPYAICGAPRAGERCRMAGTPWASTPAATPLATPEGG